MPHNESEIRNRIESFLSQLPSLYRSLICSVANPIADEDGMWGAFLELQQIGIYLNLAITVHVKNDLLARHITTSSIPIAELDTTLPRVGSENGNAIDVLLTGENIGCGHYYLLERATLAVAPSNVDPNTVDPSAIDSLSIPATSPYFHIHRTDATGDCMFDACIQATKLLSGAPLAISTIEEIRQLRVHIASMLVDEDIIALFKNYILTEFKASAIEAKRRIPDGPLLRQAQELRKAYNSAIRYSNALRALASGDLGSFKDFATCEPEVISILREQRVSTPGTSTLLEQIVHFTSIDPDHTHEHISAQQQLCAHVLRIMHQTFYLDLNTQETYHDLEEKNSYLTPLHCALMARNMPAVIALCELGVDLTIKTKAGLTAIDLAMAISEAHGDASFAQYLSAKAAQLQLPATCCSMLVTPNMQLSFDAITMREPKIMMAIPLDGPKDVIQPGVRNVTFSEIHSVVSISDSEVATNISGDSPLVRSRAQRHTAVVLNNPSISGPNEQAESIPPKPDHTNVAIHRARHHTTQPYNTKTQPPTHQSDSEDETTSLLHDLCTHRAIVVCNGSHEDADMDDRGAEEKPPLYLPRSRTLKK